MRRPTSDQTQVGINGSVVAPDEALVATFIREYLDNGLVAFDRERRRFGIVTDYDRHGRCFVVQLSQPAVSLCIPVGFVRSVRRGRVYLTQRVRDLVGARPAMAAAESFEINRPLARVVRLLAFWSGVSTNPNIRATKTGEPEHSRGSERSHT